MDALVIAFKTPYPEAALVQVSSALRGYSGTGHLAVAGIEFKVKQVGQRFHLQNHDCTLMVGRDQTEFDLTFQAAAIFLRTNDLCAVLGIANHLARALGAGEPEETRVRRLDLFMDVCGVSFDASDVGSFVSRARKRPRFHAPEKVHDRKKRGTIRTTGFTFAPGNPLVARLYDKLEELEAVAGDDSRKTRTELNRYDSAGWDGSQRIWRLEAQLRSKALRKQHITTPDELEARIPAVWEYAFAGARPWLRLVVPCSATRVERQELDPRWACFAENPFGTPQPPSNDEAGSLNKLTPQQMLGTQNSLLAGHERFPDLEDGLSRREILERDSLAAAHLLDELLPEHVDVVSKRSEARANVARSHTEPTPMGDAP